ERRPSGIDSEFHPVRYRYRTGGINKANRVKHYRLSSKYYRKTKDNPVKLLWSNRVCMASRASRPGIRV
ncbi:hypothetical protein KAX02_06975, partial [candidate division WOR-3 bacterium]|nr:hypothetical protein [candidate division WOR-3 bacterium]